MAEPQVEMAPQKDTTFPEDSAQVGQGSYPMIYPYMDSYGTPIGHGGPQVMPTAYYFQPQVYSYPVPPQGSQGGPEEGMVPMPNFYGMPSTPRAPDGSSVVYGAWTPSATPEGGFYAPAPGMGFPYGQAMPPGQWVGCSCAGCRTPVSSHGTPHVPSAPPSSGRTESEAFPAAGPPSGQSAKTAPPQNGSGPVTGSSTPLSSRAGGENSDLRRRIFPTRPGPNCSLEGSLNGSPGPFPDRSKKRKMGYLNNILYKTEMCRDFQQSGNCPRGKNCQFAHGGAEVHHPRNHPLYKTAFCFDFKKDGQCPRGDACFHVHQAGEMREKPSRGRAGRTGGRFSRQGRAGTPKGSPMISARSRVQPSPSPGPAASSPSPSNAGTSGEAIPNPSDVKNTMRLLQRLSSENTANLLKKLSEGDALRGSPLRH